MIAHKKIRINDKNQRRRGASPFVHEVYFKLSTADSEQVIVQGHGPTAQGHRKDDSSLVGPPDKTWKIRKSPLTAYQPNAADLAKAKPPTLEKRHRSRA